MAGSLIRRLRVQATQTLTRFITPSIPLSGRPNANLLSSLFGATRPLGVVSPLQSKLMSTAAGDLFTNRQSSKKEPYKAAIEYQHDVRVKGTTSRIVESKYDLIGAVEGLDPIWMSSLSGLSWCGIAEGVWVLELFSKGHVLLTRTDPELSHGWKLTMHPSHLLKVGPLDIPEPIHFSTLAEVDSKTEDLLLRVAVSDLASFSAHMDVLTRSASWRNKFSTPAQQRYLSHTLSISPTAESWKGDIFGEIAGGWVGRKWEQAVPVHTLTRGEASDVLQKMICGRMAMRLRKDWQEQWGQLNADGKHDGVAHSSMLDKLLREYYF